jgi:hypothetical protein
MGSESTSDSDDLGEESAAWVSHSTTLSSQGVALTWPPGNDKVNWLEFSNIYLPHVAVPPHARPVVRQHSVAVRIVLDLPADLEASPLKCQINAPGQMPEKSDPADSRFSDIGHHLLRCKATKRVTLSHYTIM